MTAPNYFGWIDTMAELRNEKRKAKQYAAEVGNDISDLDALTLAMALDACQTDPAHILNAETFWTDADLGRRVIISGGEVLELDGVRIPKSLIDAQMRRDEEDMPF